MAKVEWKRAPKGYVSKCGRFRVERFAAMGHTARSEVVQWDLYDITVTNTRPIEVCSKAGDAKMVAEMRAA